MIVEKDIEFYTDNQQCDRRAEVEKLLTFENDDIISTPIIICPQNALVYAAVKIENKVTKESKVTAKVFFTKTNLRWNKKLQYEEFSEDTCPTHQSCPSSILKILSETDNKNAQMWRQNCKDRLDGLAAEKKCTVSLTNLPLETRIRLIDKKNEDGSDIILVKDKFPNYCHPVWCDEDTYDKYKMCDIQQYGYEIIKERG